MTKGDQYAKQILQEILNNGTMDENPRPHYEDVIKNASVIDVKKISIKNEDSSTKTITTIKDEQSLVQDGNNVIICTPAYTKFINHTFVQYDYQKNECPIWTLRPIAWKSAINEILWIYQMQSNKLSDLHDLGIHYWDDWDIGDGTIGCRYGATVKRHNLINRLLKELKENPFGRRHIMNLWQEDDFHDETGGTTKGLNPCCYETIWNCRRGVDNEIYLDVLLNQRSSDFATSVAINELQYQALQLMIAKHLGYKPGIFTHVTENVQIYDRHIAQVEQLLKREYIETLNPIRLILNTDKTDFFSFTINDFKMDNYPLEKIKEENPQLKFQLAI